jgi:hypothetical protein
MPDKRPSFGVFEKDGAYYWKCQSGCGQGDQIDFLAVHNGTDTKEATKEFLRMAGIDKAEASAKAAVSERELGNGKVLTSAKLSSATMLPVRFIDKPLFQMDAFHLLAGKKNAGKGTFLTAIASRFTRGELGDKRNVYWIPAGEDSVRIDVLPRVIAAGGYPDRIHYPNASIPKLPQDIPWLQEEIKRIGDVGLVVLDPISGMLNAGANANKDTEVRNAISPLNYLADAENCLIVGVRHLGKGASEREALDAVLGSVEWVNIPRAVLIVAIDNEDDSVRHVQVKAGNRVPRGTASRSFRIEGVNVVKGGEPVTKAVFIEGDGKDVEDMLRAEPGVSNTKINRGKNALLDKLEQIDDDIESDTWTAEVAQKTGISDRTLKRAKQWLKEAGLIAYRPVKDGSGKVLQWRVKRTNAPRPLEMLSDPQKTTIPSKSPGTETGYSGGTLANHNTTTIPPEDHIFVSGETVGTLAFGGEDSDEDARITVADFDPSYDPDWWKKPKSQEPLKLSFPSLREWALTTPEGQEAMRNPRGFPDRQIIRMKQRGEWPHRSATPADLERAALLPGS